LALTSDRLALLSGLNGAFVRSIGSGVRNDHNLNSPDTTAGTDGNLEKKIDWLENSNSSVSLAGQKLAQLIGNRQKLETAAASRKFSRQIPRDFPATSNN